MICTENIHIILMQLIVANHNVSCKEKWLQIGFIGCGFLIVEGESYYPYRSRRQIGEF
jgi:hypothetical protein